MRMGINVKKHYMLHGRANNRLLLSTVIGRRQKINALIKIDTYFIPSLFKISIK